MKVLLQGRKVGSRRRGQLGGFPVGRSIFLGICNIHILGIAHILILFFGGGFLITALHISLSTPLQQTPEDFCHKPCEKENDDCPKKDAKKHRYYPFLIGL